MDRKFLILLATILTFGLLGVSCGSESDPLPEPPSDGTVTLVLDLGINAGPASAGASRSFSRAGEDDVWEYEAPANIYEKVNTLRIIIVRPNNIVEVNQLITGEAPAGKPDFFLPNVATQLANLGRFSFKVIDNETKKIYLIANEASISLAALKGLDNINEGELLQSLPSLVLEVQPQNETDGGFYIDNSLPSKSFVPMTETFEVEVNSKQKGEIVQNGTNGIVYEQIANLFVTRATTKFSFSAETTNLMEGSTLQITGITISGLGTKEFLFPPFDTTTYNPAKDVAATDRMITSTSFPADVKTYPFTFTPTDFKMEGIEGDGKVQATYVPEIYFLESIAKEFTVTVTTEVDGKSHTWEAKPLTNLPYLYRNTHVRIHFAFRQATMSATVKLVPWIGVPLDYTWGFNELVPWNRN